MGQPQPLFRLFLVFSNKQYNFYNKSMWKNVQMSIQYLAPGFEPTTFRTWIVTHYHWTRAFYVKTNNRTTCHQIVFTKVDVVPDETFMNAKMF